MAAPLALAFCPHPPLLIPAVGGSALDENTEVVALREACSEAVAALVATEPAGIVVVGTGAQTRTHGASAVGTFAGFGVDITVTLGSGASAGDAELPLSLTVGAWLLREAGWTGEVGGLEVAVERPSADCAELGPYLADERTALLVMGDGSARRSAAAPGYLDDRAEPFDAAVAAALSSGDASALASLDASLAAELMVAGRAAWQVAAAAVLSADAPPNYVADVMLASDPFGVAYFVATWLPGHV